METQEKLPEVMPQEQPPEKKIDVDYLINQTSTTDQVMKMFPNHKESLQRNQDGFEPVVNQVLSDLVNGKRTIEEVQSFLLKERSLQMEVGRMDQLSGELKKDQLVDELQRVIDSLQSLQGEHDTIDLYFIDLVNFKNVNDKLGQQGGDRVLQTAANRFRELFPRGIPMLGGRVGDEFIYYRRRPQDEKSEFDFEKKIANNEAPNKLTTVHTREGDIDVYYHIGKATFDPSLDIPRIEKDERGTERTITPAASLLQRADEVASENKKTNKKLYPELYLERHS